MNHISFSSVMNMGLKVEQGVAVMGTIHFLHSGCWSSFSCVYGASGSVW